MKTGLVLHLFELPSNIATRVLGLCPSPLPNKASPVVFLGVILSFREVE